MKAADIRRKVGGMHKHKQAATPMPDVPDRPEDWREQIKADLANQLEAGGTLYGFRRDGIWIARTRDGDRVIERPNSGNYLDELGPIRTGPMQYE